ncbi:MAG: tRNA preQ1(34) S-adenosylmethionine ribosyltransferase-isomerase QueA [Alphaproteobacteria bacterium]|nr:MAG: tRNA preQ1(34) S-adenosylmethionine ribosyltransferase-isomerase QueA [Rickettsiaceae bacterium 4572_127]
MKLSDFNFDLPEELIAKYPPENRTDSRMLVVPKNLDKKFTDFPDLLNAGDVLVLNNTKVIPARIYGVRGEAKIEATLHKKIDERTWLAFVKNSKRLKINDTIDFSKMTAKVLEKTDAGTLLKFNKSGENLLAILDKIGHMPLPPYMKRNDDSADKLRYQTVFAERNGSVAAPTAGLHFTDEILKKIKAKNVKIVFVTLHVGAGTFLPVKTENLDEHIMHSEWGEIDKKTADILNKTRESGGRIIAVGTTATRILETATNNKKIVESFCGETDIFITPGYKFKAIDVMLTNFHLPKSTLFMLVSALAGTSEMKSAYAHAIEKKYRFYSYGDCCLLEKKERK